MVNTYYTAQISITNRLEFRALWENKAHTNIWSFCLTRKSVNKVFVSQSVQKTSIAWLWDLFKVRRASNAKQEPKIIKVDKYISTILNPCCFQLIIFLFVASRNVVTNHNTHTHTLSCPGLPARLLAFNMQQTNMAALKSCFHAARFLPAPTVTRGREQRSVWERPSQTIRPRSPWRGSNRDFRYKR